MNARILSKAAFTLIIPAVLVAIQPVLSSERQDAVNAALAAEAERRQVLASLGDNLTVRWGDHGSIRRIRGELDFTRPTPEAVADSGDDLLVALRVPLGFHGEEALISPRVSSGALGVSFLRFDQLIDGIPVAGASLAVRYDADGRATAISANVLVDDGLPRVPSLTQIEGIRAATEYAFPQKSAATEAVRLVYYLGPDHRGRLAWEAQVARRPADDAPEAYRVFVDAITGEHLASHPLVHHGLYRRVYSANNGTNYTASLLIQEGGSTSDPDGDAVYDNSGIVYDFYDSVFGRDSFNGAGAAINSTVNYLSNYNSAFYDRSANRFIYGDGDGSTTAPYGRSLDIVAHEITHGVTRYSTDLVYEDESGAINEAYSDIFAAVIDAHENGVSASTWRLGEDVYQPSNPTTALHYLNDPVADGTSRDDYENLYTGSADNGGVHWNSGIANLAFYLLSQGGTHPRGVTTNNVPAIGITKAQAIFYNTLIGQCLSPNNEDAFAELRSCTTTEAASLYGSTEANSVFQAFNAVRVPGGSGSAPGAPVSFSAQTEHCFGYYTASWSSSPGASSYQVWHASTPQGLATGNLLYGGSATSAWVDIPYSGYMGVRACNSSGCSDFTVGGNYGRLSSCQ